MRDDRGVVSLRTNVKQSRKMVYGLPRPNGLAMTRWDMDCFGASLLAMTKIKGAMVMGIP